jgi:hypothetical protein
MISFEPFQCQNVIVLHYVSFTLHFKITSKFAHVPKHHAMEAYSGHGGKAPCSLYFGIKRRQVINLILAALSLRNEPLIPI